jgi:hypothetical protein
MRSTAVAALFALSLLPLAALAQTSPQPATPDNSATAEPQRAGGITKEQFIQHAQDRAARRATAQFDRMDTDHDGVLEPSEVRAWRNQRARNAASRPDPLLQQ